MRRVHEVWVCDACNQEVAPGVSAVVEVEPKLGFMPLRVNLDICPACAAKTPVAALNGIAERLAHGPPSQNGG